MLIGLLSVVVISGIVVTLTPTIQQTAATGVYGKFKKDKCEVPPTWSEIIRGKKRWVKVWDGAAYCDRQTGLVWEGEPVDADTTFTWGEATAHCIRRIVEGATGQKGWRLSAIPELASLTDTSSTTCTGGGGSICLPNGHPFGNVQSAAYWSSSESAEDSNLGWNVSFQNGGVRVSTKGGNRFHAWCVRGAMQESVY